jgi:SAM-dependent methyltransferase
MDVFPQAMVNQVSTRGRTSSVESPIDLAAQAGRPKAAARTPAARIWTAINRNPGPVLIGLIAFYLAIACAQGATKLLWGDELITLAIARQGSLSGIWRALAVGADPNPPLSHWMVLQSTRIFGAAALAVRLPAILCVLLAIVCLWAVLRRWIAPGYAAVGVLAFMATRGFDYAYDARSYAPLMAFSMASLACWLISVDRRGWTRFAALTGMAAALALGVSSNYYGVLAFFPIALGEAVRAIRTRSVEPGAWLAMAAAALPLLAFRPLIRHNLAEFAPHAWNPARAGMVADSYLVLVEGVFWPVLALALFAAWKSWKRPAPRDPHKTLASNRSLQPHEVAALAVLILYPVLGFSIAAAGGGMISARCVVPVCCGFGIAAALLAQRVFATSARAGVLLLTGALLWVAARESACAFVLAQQRNAFFAIRDEVARRPGDQPIVIGDSLIVLPLAHYSAEDVRARIVFPIDFDAIHRTEPDDSGEQNLWAGRDGVFPIRIAPYDSSLFAGREIAVIARPSGWLSQRLAADGFRLGAPGENPAWQQLGGIFTPLAHEDTRLFTAGR